MVCNRTTLCTVGRGPAESEAASIVLLSSAPGRCAWLWQLLDHWDRLPEDLRAGVRDGIEHACRSIMRRNVGPGYTNIALMGAYGTLLAESLLQCWRCWPGLRCSNPRKTRLKWVRLLKPHA